MPADDCGQTEDAPIQRISCNTASAAILVFAYSSPSLGRSGSPTRISGSASRRYQGCQMNRHIDLYTCSGQVFGKCDVPEYTSGVFEQGRELFADVPCVTLESRHRAVVAFPELRHDLAAWRACRSGKQHARHWHFGLRVTNYPAFHTRMSPRPVCTSGVRRQRIATQGSGSLCNPAFLLFDFPFSGCTPPASSRFASA